MKTVVKISAENQELINEIVEVQSFDEAWSMVETYTKEKLNIVGLNAISYFKNNYDIHQVWKDYQQIVIEEEVDLISFKISLKAIDTEKDLATLRHFLEELELSNALHFIKKMEEAPKHVEKKIETLVEMFGGSKSYFNDEEQLVTELAVSSILRELQLQNSFYRISRTDEVDYDEFQALMVRAQNETKAYEIAKTHTGYFTRENTKIELVDVNGSEEVVMSDFLEA